jgi:biotin carboxyl carrier protein
MQNKDEKLDFKTLVINETEYKTLLTNKFENRKPWVKPDEKKILAYLPGTALKVNIKKGDKIKPGQELMVFEAMKMKNSIRVKKEGIVKEVHVKVGDSFPKNFLMLEME